MIGDKAKKGVIPDLKKLLKDEEYQGFADGGESDNVYRINTINGEIEVKNQILDGMLLLL